MNKIEESIKQAYIEGLKLGRKESRKTGREIEHMDSGEMAEVIAEQKAQEIAEEFLVSSTDELEVWANGKKKGKLKKVDDEGVLDQNNDFGFFKFHHIQLINSNTGFIVMDNKKG